jgi:hypothetical protein
MPPRPDAADDAKPLRERTQGVVELATEGGRPVRARREPRSEELPAERHARFEKFLCRAVAERALVELRYDNEVPARLFAPHVVYRSTTGKINVSGTQLLNPGQPEDSYEPRIFRDRPDPDPAADGHQLPAGRAGGPGGPALPERGDLRGVTPGRRRPCPNHRGVVEEEPQRGSVFRGAPTA